jgi:thiamine biosynthesis lipoprotein
MASPAHVVVTGRDGERLADHAVARVEDLEQRWSRFIATSELSRINAAAGAWVDVSWETLDLVTRSLHAWRATAGLFDPTITSVLLALGHDAALAPEAPPTTSWRLGAGEVEVDEANLRVRAPAGVALDPGGIGKGLAADIVVAELLDAGAAGACVNLGGDLAVAGEPPTGPGWVIGVAEPVLRAEDVATVTVAHGGVATSSRLARTWAQHGVERHHLVDPRTGCDVATRAPRSVTVFAGEAWWAEALATAIAVSEPREGDELLRAGSATAIVVDADGELREVGEVTA